MILDVYSEYEWYYDQLERDHTDRLFDGMTIFGNIMILFSILFSIAFTIVFVTIIVKAVKAAKNNSINIQNKDFVETDIDPVKENKTQDDDKSDDDDDYVRCEYCGSRVKKEEINCPNCGAKL